MRNFIMVFFILLNSAVATYAGAPENKRQNVKSKAVDFKDYDKFSKACISLNDNSKEYDSLLTEYAKKGSKIGKTNIKRLKAFQKEYDKYGEACHYQPVQARAR